MLNKLKSLFKRNKSEQQNTVAKADSSICGVPITPVTATKLRMFCDEGIGQVFRVYYASKETIYLIATGGIFTISTKLDEPPVLLDMIENAPIAQLDFHSEKEFALVYGEGLCLWTDHAKKEIDRVEGFAARSVSWFSDGDKLLSGWSENDSDWYGEGIARITNLQGELQWEKRVDDSWIIVSACGQSYYAFGSSTGSIWVYANDHTEVCKIELEGLSPLPEILCFAEDTLYIVSVDDNFELRVLKWTPEKTELIEQETVAGHDQTCISTDKRIAFITGENTEKRKPDRVYIKSLEEGVEKSAPVEGEVKAIGFSPDNKSLVIVDESGIKSISSANARTKAFCSLGDSANCNEITVSEYSDYIANWGPSAHEVIFLSKEDGKEVKRMPAVGGWGAIFLPNGILATATPKGLFYLDPENETTQNTSITEDVSHLLLLHDKKILVISGKTISGNYGHQLIFYDITTGETKNVPCHEGFIHKVVELVKHDLLLTFSARRNADFYHVAKNECIKRLHVSLYYVSVSPDENYFAWVEKVLSEENRAISISKGVNGIVNQISMGPQMEPLQSMKLAFSPDSTKLLVTSGITAVVDVKTLTVTKEIELQGDIVWSPTGDIFVIGGAYEPESNLPFRSNKFIIYDKEGNYLAEYSVKRRVRELRFSHDGTKIIVLCEYGGVFVFKVKQDI